MTNTQETLFSHTAMLPKTILVVDGSVFIRNILEKMMHIETHYQLIFASTCTEALEIVSIIKPHIFLLDYQLPDMNGLELYDKLHARKTLKNIPAIIMSGELPSTEIEKRNLLGVEKPFHPNILFHMIEGVMQSTQIEPTSNRSFSTTGILALAF